MHGYVQEVTQNRNDKKASTTSKERLRVSNMHRPHEKAAKQSADWLVFAAVCEARGFGAEEFLQETRDISIKNHSDPGSKS